MTSNDSDLDEYGKRVLKPLRSTPTLDPVSTREIKAKFLLHGESLRKGLISQANGVLPDQVLRKPKFFRINLRMPVIKALVGTLIALIILIGSSLTVYASQSSLPGESLYLIKSWSEDIRLSIASSPQAKLNLTLDFTYRRMDEISSLVETGNALPAQASERFQGELDSALQLAAEMENGQMQNALGKIKHQAESQGITIEELISKLPEQAEPAIIHLQERLQEQVTLSTIGESDPQAFRSQVIERQHRRPVTNKSTPASESTDIHPTDSSGKNHPTEDGNGHGNDKGKPTEVPDHGNSGGGQDKSTPGSGDHRQEPDRNQNP
jgi:hypothetical protein